jgi:hypothetical protein
LVTLTLDPDSCSQLLSIPQKWGGPTLSPGQEGKGKELANVQFFLLVGEKWIAVHQKSVGGDCAGDEDATFLHPRYKLTLDDIYFLIKNILN